VAFIVLHYLKDFPATYECFQRESASLTKVVGADTPPKDLTAILTEYAQLKLDAVRRDRFVAFCDNSHSGDGSLENSNFIQNTLSGLSNLISDYQSFRRNILSRLDVSSDFLPVTSGLSSSLNTSNGNPFSYDNNDNLTGGRTITQATALSLDILPEITPNVKPYLAHDNSTLVSSKIETLSPPSRPAKPKSTLPISSSKFLTSSFSKEEIELKNFKNETNKKIIEIVINEKNKILVKKVKN